ncbi:hypothetical protein SS05631_c30330 [Sinorhizobium sp. CCBAU 05631]|nr:hypothetical protein SS05631_c30330 [Sinorhizobium sp. CCBAU 05631]
MLLEKPARKSPLTGLHLRHPVRGNYTAFILKYVDTSSYRF